MSCTNFGATVSLMTVQHKIQLILDMNYLCFTEINNEQEIGSTTGNTAKRQLNPKKKPPHKNAMPLLSFFSLFLL